MPKKMPPNPGVWTSYHRGTFDREKIEKEAAAKRDREAKSRAATDEAPPERIAYCGGPRVGKTTMAGPDAKHSDDFAGKPRGPGGFREMDPASDWDAQSTRTAKWFDEPGPLVVEGVRVTSALRKWLKEHPTGKPVDKVVFLTKPHEDLNRHQAAMAIGIQTVMSEIEPELRRRGVKIERK